MHDLTKAKDAMAGLEHELQLIFHMLHSSTISDTDKIKIAVKKLDDILSEV